MLGYEREEIIGKSYADFIHPDHRQSFEKNFPEFKRRGYVHDVQYKIRKKDGRYLEISFEGTIVSNPDGSFRQTHCVFQDITDRKLVERELQNNQYYLKKAQEIGKIGTWELDIINNVLTWTEENYKVFGVPLGTKLDYEVFLNCVHPDDRAYVNKRWQDALDHVPYEIEHRVIAQGKVKWVREKAEIEFDENGKALKAIGFTQDITHHKQTEEQIFRHNQILEGTLNEIYFFDPETLLLEEANRGAIENLGYSMEELRSMTPLDLKPELTREVFEEIVEPLRSGVEKKIKFETLHRRKDGTLYPVEVHIQLLKERNPVFIAIILDITDRRNAENEKRLLEEQYNQAQKVESIGRLAGGVAHDLNNLLTPILGYSEMLMDDQDSGDARYDSLIEIHKAGTRARDLVSQLLAFSRKQTLRFRQLDMNLVLTEFENLLRRTIRENIEINLILSPDTSISTADIRQLEQVIMNLAVNAQDAMPDGGYLTIQTSKVFLDESNASSHHGVKPGEYLVLAVSDTGSGIDDETVGYIFEPFFSTKGEQGTGLGLATVHGIVKQHNGNIRVHSEAGKGTTFEVFLPVKTDLNVAEVPGKNRKSETNGSETILLVEDNDQVRHLARAILGRKGYAILEAVNGREALKTLESSNTPVDLLLTDVVMPGMSGRNLYEKIAEKQPGIKVLYMSGYTDNEIARSGVLEEGVDFIQKPFSVDSLNSKVRKVLDRGNN